MGLQKRLHACIDIYYIYCSFRLLQHFSLEQKQHQSTPYHNHEFNDAIHLIYTLSKRNLIREPEYRRNEFPSLAANPPRCGPNRSLCSFHLSRCIVRNFKPTILPVCLTRTPQARQATTRGSGSCGLVGPAPESREGPPNVSISTCNPP